MLDISASADSWLAELPISAEQVQLLLYAIIAAVVVGGLGSIKAVLDIVRFFRGDPPGDQKYASKTDLAALATETNAVERRLVDALSEHKAAVSADRRELRETMSEIFERVDSMNRSLGRIEGKLDNK